MTLRPTYRCIAVAAFVLFQMMNCFSQPSAPTPLSLDRIFKKPYIAGTRPTSPRLSPDGKLLLYRWDSTANNKYRHWMMNTDGTGSKMSADTLLGEVAWSPDGITIACTRKGDVFLTDTSFKRFTRLTKSDVREGSLTWSMDGKQLAFSSGDKLIATATDRPGSFEIAKSSTKGSSLNIFEFAPDGKRLLFSESVDEGLPEFITPRFTGKDVTTSSFKGGVSKMSIGLAPVDTGKTLWIKLPDDDRFFLGDVTLSPDGKSICVERFTSNRKKRELFIADTDSGKPKRVFVETDDAWVEGGLYTTRWMPDGKHVVTTSEKEGWNHLYIMSPEGKNIKKLTEGSWEIRWFDIHPAGAKIFFLANKEEHAQWQLYSIDLESRSIDRLSSRPGTYENPTMAKDGSFILSGYSNFAQPTEFVRVSTQMNLQDQPMATNSVTPRNEEVQLTKMISAEFNSINWVTPEIVHFTSRDGEYVPAMIYKPTDFSSAKKYPVVVFVHGAGYLQNIFRGWSNYYREGMFHQRLVERGYVVFEVEYRGSAGLGRKFRTDVAMHLGGKDLADELDGLEYLRQLGYIDTQRVGMYGGSYGGFMTLMALFQTDKYACGAALRAVTSWENYYRHNPWYTEARLGKPEEHAEAYKISSPITYADSLKKPLLVLHGMVDDNVFFQDAVQLIAKLQKAGKKFDVMMYPDEAHSFTEPESWYDEYYRIEEFFDKHLKPTATR